MATILIGVAINAGFYFLNRALTPTTKVTSEGSRLKEAQITSSTEGMSVPRLFGRMRLGGNMFWATRFKETITTTTIKTPRPGKGGGGGGGTETTTITYTYSCSFAIGFCEGSMRTQLSRVWADGKLLDMSKISWRFYSGTDTQTPDSYMETVEGAGNVPAYRGLAYLVFEEFELADFGNRIPQITAEIINPLDTTGPDDLEELVKSVCILPGHGEFALATNSYVSDDGKGSSVTQNVNNNSGAADFIKSVDNLQLTAQNVRTAVLVVSWFGDDLRAGRTTVKPKKTGSAVTLPNDWKVSGVQRSSAEFVSILPSGVPAFGGTPSDVSLKEAIANLKARGWRVVLCPVLSMDIPPDNGLKNPYVAETPVQQSLNGYEAIGYRNAYDFHVSDDGSQLRVLSVQGSTKRVELFNLPIPYETQYAVYVGTESSSTDHNFQLPSYIEFPYGSFWPLNNSINAPPGSYQSNYYNVPNFINPAYIDRFASAQSTDVGIVYTAGYFLDNSNREGEPNGFYIKVKGPGFSHLKYVGPYLNTFNPFGNMHNLSGTRWQWHWSPDGHYFGYSSAEQGGRAFTTYLEQPFDISDLNGSTVWDGDLSGVWIANAPTSGARPGQFSANGAKFYGFRWGTPWYIDSIDLCKPWKPSTASLSGCVVQPAYPWRGKITCDKAPGVSGTVDGSAAAGTQVTSFFGTAAVSNVPAGSDGLPAWTGSAGNWGYRRMVLHYARLCQMAGGVDAFLIGSELAGLTKLWSGSSYPAVDALVTLAADVRSIVGAGTKISYGADWTEYHSQRAGQSVTFNMDPLWASPNIDFIGIDGFFPLSDWRDGTAHADYNPQTGATSPYSMSYLKSRVEGGELYDWTYTSESNRLNQVRTAISDPGYGKPWVFRQKDIKNWWANAHKNRNGSGLESGSTTSWVPQSKPIWLTAFGFPAQNRGANQPSVFYDLKSSEADLVYFGSGQRDDFMQRRALEAVLMHWRDNSPNSNVYSGKMIRRDDMAVWCWDARPYPEFPFRSDIWSDAENWRLGHWLTGRLGAVPLALLVKKICALAGLTDSDVDVSGLYGSDVVVTGYVIDKIMSSRDMLELLMLTYSFDGFESDGLLKFVFKTENPVVTLDLDDLVTSEEDPGGYSVTRGQETELPKTVKVSFYDEGRDYEQSSTDGRKSTGNSRNTTSVDLPLVLGTEYARSLADTLVQQAWASRDQAELTLPSKFLRVDPGDIIQMVIKGRQYRFRVGNIDSGATRQVSAVSFDETVFTGMRYDSPLGRTGAIPVYGRSLVTFMDIPLETGEEVRPWAPRLLAYQKPWPGAVNVFEDDDAGGFSLDTQIRAPSVVGELIAPLGPGPTDLWDNANSILLDIYGDAQLLSTTDLAVLNGANKIAIQNQDGGWEVAQFATALLVSARRYKLTRLLRGRFGSEGQMRASVPANSRVVIISQSLLEAADQPLSSLNVANTFRYGPGPKPVEDALYQQVSLTFKGTGLLPHAPVHLKAIRGGSGLTLKWFRRTRFGGDGWGASDIPLNEEKEAYEVDIMNGSSVVRTLTSLSNSVLYPTASEIADFGFAQTSLKFRVYQMSTTVGRGSPGEKTVTVT
jgi:hypothetical protein